MRFLQWLTTFSLVLMAAFALAQNPVTVNELSRLTYGGGGLEVVRTMERNESFTRYLVRYPSDGLQMYGFMNVPNASGRFPVVVVIHGYVNPATYRTLAYTTRYADNLARAGFVAIHPNLRGHGLSQGRAEGATWRVEYAREILDLAAIVRTMAGKPGPLQKATANIGLMGHSMGGGVAQRVAVLDPQIKGVVLYGSMHGDELKNARQIYYVFSGRERGLRELNTDPARVALISPINYYGRIRAQVQVHHGTADEQVPYAWAGEMCAALDKFEVRHACFSYQGARHTFRGSYYSTFTARVRAFFNETLR